MGNKYILLVSCIFILLICVPVWSYIVQMKVKKRRPFKAALPGNLSREGELNPTSQTWAYIEQWAIQKLDETRIANDNIRKSDIETAALRGSIKILTELISLPEKPAKVIIFPDYTEADRDNFAGY